MVRKRSRFINRERPSRFLPAKFRKDEPLHHRPRPRSARSSVRASSVFTPRSARYSYDDEYIPYSRPLYSSFGRYDTTGEDNMTRSQINRNLILSSAALDDNYDISLRSRNRDKDVLAAANRAITPPPSTAALELESRGVSSVPRRSALRRSQSARSIRSYSVPPIRPTYTQTESSALVPVDTTSLRASAAPKPSQYLRYSKAMETAKSLREGTYSPMYSNSVRTSVSPFRDRSFSRLRSESPYRSPSPVGRDSPERTGRMLQRRRKPRVLANKRRVGNYYNRLLTKRESDGRECKYWPYLDVDEIEATDLGDVCSDSEEYNDNRGESYMVQGYRAREYDDDQEEATPVRYVYEYEQDIPDDYVPFRPKVRYRSPERDYSKMSIIPYLPHRDPSKDSVSDTITFNAIVAESAARARQALERINWNDYDSAGLVLTVEGEYHTPENAPLGFSYVSRPIALKVAAADKVSAYDSDTTFTKYWNDLQKFRESIRLRLEEGYKALSSSTRSYTPALTYTSPPSSTSNSSALTSYSSRPHRNSYYKRLRDDKDYKYGQSIELYPLESSKGTLTSRRALRSSDDDLPTSRASPSRAVSVYDSKSDSDSNISVLAKIKIKVDTEMHSSPRSAVAARRVMRGQSTPPSAFHSKTEAALIGSKVDVVSPDSGFRRRPKSAYAQSRVRQMESSRRLKDDSPVAVIAERTTDLKASRPVYAPTLVKPIHDVDGLKQPSNILSWQYKLDAIASPDDFIIVPRSLGSVKAQLRDAREKMVKHRQLMDRYLNTDSGLSFEDKMGMVIINPDRLDRKWFFSVQFLRENIVFHNPRLYMYNSEQNAIPDDDKYKGPMSSARRRARRVLCVTKGNLNYYKHKD